MLYVVAVTMIVLWLLVVSTPLAKGGMVHVLLVIALVAIAIRLMRRQNVWVTRGPHSGVLKSIVRRYGKSLRPAKQKAA
jgi:hypothetical protein